MPMRIKRDARDWMGTPNLPFFTADRFLAIIPLFLLPSSVLTVVLRVGVWIPSAPPVFDS